MPIAVSYCSIVVIAVCTAAVAAATAACNEADDAPACRQNIRPLLSSMLAMQRAGDIQVLGSPV